MTICTKDRNTLLSRIVGGGFHAAPKIELSLIGMEVLKTIEYIDKNYDDVVVDKYVIMPNHVHLILVLEAGGHGNPPLQNIIGQLKSYTTKQYNRIQISINERLWQKSFYDHIIRNQEDYQQIWKYIDDDPLKWEKDTYYSL